MSDWQARIEAKIDKMGDTQTDQAVTLARLTTSVEEHVKRSNLLEEDIKPIKRHVNMVEGALKLIGLIGILAAITESIHLILK